MASPAVIAAVLLIGMIAAFAVANKAGVITYLGENMPNVPSTSTPSTSSPSSTPSTSSSPSPSSEPSASSLNGHWTLTVYSTYGNPTPAVGSSLYGDVTSVFCSVSSTVTVSGVTYICTGWTGTGSVPASGTDNSVTFTMLQDSSITWTWKVSTTSSTPAYGPWTLTVVSGHGRPVPMGSSQFNDWSTVTCMVTSPIVENGITYTCTGWTGTGSVPESGTTTSVQFTIFQDSTITWNWQSSGSAPRGSVSTPTGEASISQEVVVGNGQTSITYSVTNVVGMTAWQIAIYCPQQCTFENAVFTTGTFPSNPFYVAEPVTGYPTDTWIAALFMPDGTTWSGSSALVTVTFATPTPATFLIQLQYTKLINSQNLCMPYTVAGSYTTP